MAFPVAADPHTSDVSLVSREGSVSLGGIRRPMTDEQLRLRCLGILNDINLPLNERVSAFLDEFEKYRPVDVVQFLSTPVRKGRAVSDHIESLRRDCTDWVSHDGQERILGIIQGIDAT
jgi:hypothetical protein